MKQLILNSAFLIMSTVYIIWYLRYIKKKYGPLSSISYSASKLTDDGNVVLFYIFICFAICFCLAFVAYHAITTLAASILFLIGTYTGYNPNIKNKVLENIIHVVATNSAILLFMVGIVLIHLYYLWVVIPVTIVCIILWIAKVKDHTRIIEEVVIAGVFICLTHYGVVEQILKLLK